MAITRSGFLRLMGLSAAGAAAGCMCPCGRRPRFAVQLYSVHRIFWKDPERILAALKAAGYDGVEFAGYGGRSAKDIGKLLADSGLAGAGTPDSLEPCIENRRWLRERIG